VKFTTEELGKSEILLTVEVEADQAKKLLSKAAAKISKGIKVPGYRPGKVPFNVMLRRFGQEAVQQEFFEMEGEKLIKQALEEAKIEPAPAVQMEVKEMTWQPLIFKILVPLPPKIVLGDYREIRLPVTPIKEVAEEDIENILKYQQSQNGVWTPVERAATINDMVSMVVTQKDGDKVLVNNESVDYQLTLVDESTTIDNQVVQALLGVSAGDKKTFTVNYPSDHHDHRFAGKEIAISVEVGAVKYQELDPIDDEFAKAVAGKETLAEWKDTLRENLRRSREYERDKVLGEEVLTLAVQEAQSIEWPSRLEEDLLASTIEGSQRELKQLGLTLEDYLRVKNITQEEHDETLKTDVANQLKKVLVTSELAQLEKIQVYESEILDYARRLSLRYGNDQVWQKIMQSPQQQRQIGSEIMAEKVLIRLAEIAKGEAKPIAELEDSPASEAESPN